jgi:hypothetical protein
MSANLDQHGGHGIERGSPSSLQRDPASDHFFLTSDACEPTLDDPPPNGAAGAVGFWGCLGFLASRFPRN